MIRIHRADEPPALAKAREERIVAARKAMADGAKVVFKDYDLAKAELAEMQRLKCCYCEKREEQAKYRDVEHYRPKSLYWWLAWTWENLLFACFECNRDHKKDEFPLSDGDVRLVAEESPPGLERPLVLDACDPLVDPTTEVVFRRERVQNVERWVPRSLTPRGRTTIKVCGLDRPNLIDLYKEHVVQVVRPKLETVLRAGRDGDARAVVEAWSSATRGLLAPARPFRALSHDAIDVLVTGELRARYRLELTRP